MMRLYFAITICIALCSGQPNPSGVEVTTEMMEVCLPFCRASRRCPGVTAVLNTVRRLPRGCRNCINEECGSIRRANRTEAANCQFAARLSCEECIITNATQRIRQDCMICITQCRMQVANGSRPVIPTRRPIRPGRPGRGFGRPGIVGGRRGRTGPIYPFFSGRRPSRPFGGFRPPFGGFRPRPPTGGFRPPFGGARCNCRAQCSNLIQPSSRCRQCVVSQCRAAAQQGVRGAFTACVRQARMSCEACGNNTAAHQRRSQCAECIDRCRGGRFPGRRGNRTGTIGGRGGRGMGGQGGLGGRVGRGGRRDLCARNCVAPGFCPSTAAILNTINRSPRACRDCVRASCGQMANQTRDEIAECYFNARPNCGGCRFGSASRAQRQRCTVCRMQCEDMTTMAATTTTPITTTTAAPTPASSEMEEMEES